MAEESYSEFIINNLGFKYLQEYSIAKQLY
jgi:hypothetical protein